MSISKANQFYQELTPQQKHFVDNKIINTTLSVKHWIGFLSKASAYDEYSDKARQTLSVRMSLVTVGIIGLVILAFVMENYYLFALPVILGIFLFNMAQTRSHFAKRDINNYLRLFFMPFLEVVRQKAGEEAKLSASLDFRDPFKALTPSKEEVNVHGRKRYINTYEPKMIIAGVTLLDSSYLEAVVMDEIKKVSYTNPRGKSKSKTKTVHRIFIRLTANKNVYKRNEINIPPQVEFSENTDSYLFKLKEKKKEETYGVLKPGVFFKELALLFGLLQPLHGAAAEGQTTSTEAIPAAASGIAGTGSRITEALVWNDLLFNSYDYDSVSRRGSGLLGSENESRNIFDS
ncbi:MAG: hypothetical protein JNK44_09650 [Cyclobacteriaceae bacterium]|nr:hypothetical protein [Cyclobacteriaceae bacterium]